MIMKGNFKNIEINRILKLYPKGMIVMFLLFTNQFSSFGQNNLENFEAPSMPAVSIIGSEMLEMKRLSTMAEVKLSLLTNFLDSNNSLIIPDNFGVEINPFMLSSRKKFDYIDFLGDSIADNIKQNFSISLATTKKFIVNDSVHTDALGIGFRTKILNGKFSDEIVTNYKEQFNEFKRYNKLKEEIFNELKNIAYTNNFVGFSKMNSENISGFIVSSETISDDAKELFLDLEPFMNFRSLVEMYESFDVVFDRMTSKGIRDASMFRLLEELKNQRYGHFLEVDGAVSLSFPTADFENSYIPKYGLWLNYAFRPPIKNNAKQVIGASNFEGQALVRYLWSNDDFINSFSTVDDVRFSTGSFFDFGFRINYEHNKFNGGIEYIYRLEKGTKEVTLATGEVIDIPDDNESYKLMLNLNYDIMPGVVLTYNLGKNFEFGNEGNDLITGFSINIALGSLKFDDLIESAK